MTDYVLDESEYEITETGEQIPVTSERVKKKLDGELPGPIDQSDFDDLGDEDYTLSDYFKVEEGQYPRNISDHKGEAAGGLAAGGLAFGATGGQPLTTAGIVAALSVAAYNVGLVEQEKSFDQAFENSKENLFDYF